MKRFSLFIGSLVLIILAAACGTKNLDEKLDAEYSIKKGEWKRAFVDLDNLVKKQENSRKVHDEQDSVLARLSLSSEDRAMQARHKAWFADYEKTLNEVKAWMDSATAVELRHIEMENAHDTAKAAQIRKDHEMMLNEMGEMLRRTEEYTTKLNAADSTIATFFVDHNKLNQKYGVKSEHALKPPTAK
jgi:hypothetical protein